MELEQLGPYRIIGELGRGGMGAVYKAVHVSSGNFFAVKALLDRHSQDEHFRDRFESEIETLKILKHPNIVEIDGYGEQDGILYFAMEFVDGTSLFDELRNGRKFQWREVARIGIDVCAALQHAHNHGIIHRDLKPGNLLLENSGSVKLADFGIAKLYGGLEMTAVGGVVGTADYMSPEQAHGHAVTVRSDMYSLGGVLYALIARRPPFRGNSVAETLKNLTSVDKKPPSLSEVAPQVPSELAAIVDRLLEKDPQRRIGSAQSLSKRMTAIIDEIREAPATMTNSATLVGHDVKSDDSEFVVSGEETNDPDRTVVPETMDAVSPTASEQKTAPVSSSFHRRQTEVPATVVQTAEGTSVAESEADKTPSLTTHFTKVDEEERRRADRFATKEQSYGAVWPYVVAFVLLIVVAVAGLQYSMAVKSADALYAEIDAANNRGPNELALMEPQMKQFQELYADDPRSSEIADLLTFIDRTRYTRRLRLKSQLRGALHLEPCQRELLHAHRVAETDPFEGATYFRNIVEMYADLDEQTTEIKSCVEAARYELERLNNSFEKLIAKEEKIFEQAIKKAETFQDSEPEKGVAILKAHIRNNEGKDRHAELMNRAIGLLDVLTERVALHAENEKSE